MSATNRGSERRANDFYETPEWLTRALIPEISHHVPALAPWKILEPAYGRGAIARVLRNAWPDSEIIGMELDPATAHANEGPCVPLVDNFLTAEYFEPMMFDLIVTNPPYNLAREFVTKSLTLAPIVAMLLRVNFLGSQKRAPWLREHTPAIFVTPKRPPFTTNKQGRLGTDATEYAWFVWGIEPRVKILSTELE